MTWLENSTVEPRARVEPPPPGPDRGCERLALLGRAVLPALSKRLLGRP
jgi:hypothetical protein